MEPAPYAARLPLGSGGGLRAAPSPARSPPVARRPPAFAGVRALQTCSAAGVDPLAGDFGVLSSEQHNEYYK